jgi:hypothetical protein
MLEESEKVKVKQERGPAPPPVFTFTPLTGNGLTDRFKK